MPITTKYSVGDAAAMHERKTFVRVERAVDYVLDQADWSDVEPDIRTLQRAVMIDRLFDRPFVEYGGLTIVPIRTGSARSRT